MMFCVPFAVVVLSSHDAASSTTLCAAAAEKKVEMLLKQSCDELQLLVVLTITLLGCAVNPIVYTVLNQPVRTEARRLVMVEFRRIVVSWMGRN